MTGRRRRANLPISKAVRSRSPRSALTVMVAIADDPVAPALSTAVAFSAYVPAATLDHVNEYGAVVSLPSNVVPL